MGRNSNVEVKIEKYTIPQVSCFKYHGSIIQSDEEIEGDATIGFKRGR